MIEVGPWWRRRHAPDRKRTRRRIAILVAAVATLLTALISQAPPWQLFELRAFDYLATAAPPPRPDGSPIIVAIDEPSLAEIGLQWPWPRDLHGRLIEALREAGAQAIGLDIIFAEPSTPQADAGLAAALGPDVVLAADETLVNTPQGAQLIRVEPLADLTAAGARPGIASISPDGDGIQRRVPLYDDGFAARLIQAAGSSAAGAPGGLLQPFGPSRTYETVSYYQALDPKAFLPPDTFRGRTVLVGLSLQNAPTVESRGSDAYATSWTVLNNRLLAGVEIQATIFDNLLGGLAIDRATPAIALISIAAAVLAGLVFVWRGTGWATLAGAFAGLIVIFAGSYLLLRHGRVFIPPIAPGLALILMTGSQAALDYASERRLRQGITRAFSQYLSPALVQKLADNPSQLRLGGELRTLSVLFCDIRGFTTIAEAMKDDPERLTNLVNRLLTPLSDIVLARGGTIDKYIGDCIMAFWNAPLDDPDHALHAVQSAGEMIRAIDELNRQLAAEAEALGETAHSLKVGVGINTGACVVGNMGSAQRFDYSALGDSVNLASRLESACKDLGVSIVIGQSTADVVGDRIPLQELHPITVKGRAAPIMVYTLAEA